jgi:dTDP-4-dehydrorhamnose reductase
MRIMLFGARGQVGTDCAKALKAQGYELLALSRQEVDFSDVKQLVHAVESYNPDIVVNACAYTAVDQAEVEIALADQINHISVKALAQACVKVNAFLIHISTDYVFDGVAKEPYIESSLVNPLAVYGRTKLAGERVITNAMSQYIILRTSWVFGKSGNNFVKTMLRLAGERDQLSVVSDQFGRPTYVGHIVTVILSLVERYESGEKFPSGVYHCSSRGEVSWYAFAKAIFDMAHDKGILEVVPNVEAIPSTDYPTPAPRPMYSVLDTTKLEQLLGKEMPSWQDGLTDLLSTP